ncbi:hypothetical protein N7539_005527 [Penicillium diatomitis]|uniref:Uncharacterized protein n=1 Tax=Penicillium diatomitis TaxID=2819901 RepID=A0A9W9X7J4_9EURO|nr:uncharacterized protein N7539_005527 [Penicillium diatomitis]KAJ5485539.1 hypothetical protein N7539_005527 [Penicillium diatomitis]
MLYKSLALVAGAALAAADSTVTLFLPGSDMQTADAKVVGSSNSMTTYAIDCPSGQDLSVCGLPEATWTVTQGPSSMIFTLISELTIEETCRFEGRTFAACTGLFKSGDSTSSLITTINPATWPTNYWVPVHVTATETGAVAPTTDASALASSPSMTRASAASTGTSTWTSSSQGTATETNATSASKATPTSSNAAMPAMTDTAVWLVGGAAAALAMAVVV